MTERINSGDPYIYPAGSPVMPAGGPAYGGCEQLKFLVLTSNSGIRGSIASLREILLKDEQRGFYLTNSQQGSLYVLMYVKMDAAAA